MLGGGVQAAVKTAQTADRMHALVSIFAWRQPDLDTDPRRGGWGIRRSGIAGTNDELDQVEIVRRPHGAISDGLRNDQRFASSEGVDK